MKFDILNRLSGSVQVTAVIECEDNTDVTVKLGLAVQWAVKTGANLDGANPDPLQGVFNSSARGAGCRKLSSARASGDSGNKPVTARVTAIDQRSERLSQKLHGDGASLAQRMRARARVRIDAVTLSPCHHVDQVIELAWQLPVTARLQARLGCYRRARSLSKPELNIGGAA